MDSIKISISSKSIFDEFMVTPTINGKTHVPGIAYCTDPTEAVYTAIDMRKRYEQNGHDAFFSTAQNTQKMLKRFGPDYIKEDRSTIYRI